MTLSVADLDRWDPAAVEAVTVAARRRAQVATTAAARLAGVPGMAGWRGIAAEAARAALSGAAAELAVIAEESAALARATQHAAARIARIRAELRALDLFAAQAGLAIDRSSGAVVVLENSTVTARFGDAAAVQARLADLLRRATAVDAELAGDITGAITGAVTGASTGAAAPAPLSPPNPVGPPEGAGAEDVRSWWRSLPRAEQSALIAADADRLGHLDGVPSAARDTANRAVLAADLRRVAGAAAADGVAVAAVLADPQRYGLTAADVTRYTNAARVEDSLLRNAALTGTRTLLLIYRPEEFGGQGRAAVAVGDPDVAAHTAVLVPGTGSSVASGWLSDASVPALFAEASAAAGGRTALVAYMGYDAPDSMADSRVATPGLARRGGAQLAADVHALTVTSEHGSHLTVIGHSYGSTTVADAAALHGMRADDVVLVGSPGTDMAQSAADFGLPQGGHVYVGAASTDPVTSVAGLPGPLPGTGEPLIEVALGDDPAADGFGSTRFKAEVPGFTAALWEEHSRYFETGSESLYSIADVASGHGEALEEHGMTAPHRTGLFGRWGTEWGLPTWSSPLADPELLRRATTGHFH